MRGIRSWWRAGAGAENRSSVLACDDAASAPAGGESPSRRARDGRPALRHLLRGLSLGLVVVLFAASACSVSGDDEVTTRTDVTEAERAEEPGTTEGDGSDRDEAPEQDLEADQEIADDAVLRESDLPEWDATPAEEDEDEDVSSDCLGLEGDNSDVPDTRADRPEAQSPSFEQEEAGGTSFRGVENRIGVMPDVETAEQVMEVFGDEHFGECLETVLAEEMSSDPTVEVADVEIRELDVDLGDEAVAWGLQATISSSSENDTAEGALGMTFELVRVDRAIAMFVFLGVELGGEPPTPEELVVQDAIDPVLERLETGLA